MRVYLKDNVYEAALKRIERIMTEFGRNTIVNVSGGKDSTVVFELALIVARKLNLLPLKVSWVDQEAEWAATVEQIKYHMYHPDVEPYWYQIPFKLFNATSQEESWLQCWAPEDEHKWMRPRDPIAKTENKYGTDRFTGLFKKILAVDYPNEPACNLAGVRAEESPRRALGLTSAKTYKDITWGKIIDKNKKHFDFYPLYDWSYTDIWKAIHDNNWNYNKIYDAQYQYGVNISDMRVSNVHHETAVTSLFYMQEVEPETYEKLTKRIAGIHMAAKMSFDNYFPKKLPKMFKDWYEYRDHLLDKLITREDWYSKMKAAFEKSDATYREALGDNTGMAKAGVASILTNDWELIKLTNFLANPKMLVIRKKMEGRETW